jgi:protein-S-isoprenylcysteine O-methyltransferase Ste14
MDIMIAHRHSVDLTPMIRPFRQKIRIQLLWALSILLIATVLTVQPRIPDHSFWHSAMIDGGEITLIFGVLGRLWSALYVGGRKNLELVTDGPYSLCRNPLYFSSMLAITGACMISGSMMIALVFPAAFLVVFLYTARRETLHLSSKFGPLFDEYARRTPLLIPNIRGFRGTDVRISADVLMRTARDSVFLVLLIPGMKTLTYLQASPLWDPLLSAF